MPLQLEDSSLVDKKKGELDELDSWYDEVEDTTGDIDQSAEEPEIEEEQSSGSESTEEESPDTETPEEDAEPASDSGTSDEPSKDDPYAWVQELDPEMRKRAEALVHTNRSDRGRVAALQRQLDKEAAEREARAATSSTRRSAPAVEGGTPDTTDEDLKAFAEDYPNVASSVEKMIEARVRARLDEAVTPLKEKALAEERYKEKEALRERANRIFNSAETGIQLDEVLQSPAWGQWMESQPAGYKAFARTATKAEDAAKVLEDFAAYAERKAYEEYIASGAGSAEPTVETGKGNADQVAAKRRQALAGSTPRSKTGSHDDVTLNSYNDWFDYYAEGGK